MPENREIIRAIGTCEVSNLLAEVMFQKNISVPNNFILSVKKVNKDYGSLGTNYDIYFNHPIMDLLLENTIHKNHHIKDIFIKETVKDFLKCSHLDSSLRDMMRTVNLRINRLKSDIKIHRTLDLEKYSDLSEEMIKDVYYDDKGDLEEIIGFDRVFLNIAAKYGISQEDLEACIAEEIRNLYEKVKEQKVLEKEKALGITFANEKYLKNKKNFPSSYIKPNILTHPVFEKLPAFYGSTYESKAFETSMVIGGWLYSSGKTPVLSSRIKMPETFKTAYEGEAVNRLFKEPIFGESQKIKKIWQNRQMINISITNEAVPFGEYEKILKAA